MNNPTDFINELMATITAPLRWELVKEEYMNWTSCEDVVKVDDLKLIRRFRELGFVVVEWNGVIRVLPKGSRIL